MSEPTSVPALMAPEIEKDNPLTRSVAGLLGMGFLILVGVLCLGSLPWTLGPAPGSDDTATPWYNAGAPKQGRLPPAWWPHDGGARERLLFTVDPERAREAVTPLAAEWGLPPAEALTLPHTDPRFERLFDELEPLTKNYLLGTDVLGRSLWIRILTGGGISLGIGLAAAMISVAIGTLYGALAGYAGGRVDALLMRIVDILYGLPYILLVVLIAVASEAFVDGYVSRAPDRRDYVEQQVRDVLDATTENRVTSGDVRTYIQNPASASVVSEFQETALSLYEPRRHLLGLDMERGGRTVLDIAALLVAIGGVSWLTMARVVRGQVLSLKKQPFVEAARAVGAPTPRIFIRHLLPNLLGPIIVYATLTVPQAILQESFLSFLGIGVKPPLPSWGNLASEGLTELNPYKSNWWLLFFPCLLLGVTLLALNFVGEGLREAFDPRRSRR
ncbi:MAG: ABC transporter permease [Planctomycetota bacterium]